MGTRSITSMRDMKFAFRQLIRKNPGFSFTATAVLALGICASVSIFAFVYVVLIEPLPYKNPSRLMSLNGVTEQCPVCTVSYLDFLDWKKLSTSFESMAAFVYLPLTLTTPGRRTGNRQHPCDGRRSSACSASSPCLAAIFIPARMRWNAPKTVLLSYATWQERYGGKADALGKAAILEGTPFTIIGVLPRDFHFGSTTIEYWSPLSYFSPIAANRDVGATGDHADRSPEGRRRFETEPRARS